MTDSSLSPYGLERSWNVDLEVSVGRNRWRIQGPQISYGKGLKMHQARASYLMETAERYSAFSSFSDSQTIGYKKEFKLVKSRYSDLRDKGLNALDPNEMNLEALYENQELYWIVAEELAEEGSREIYVPAQLVFLFCNLDEVSITSGITSNGLASGNTMEEAKLHALLEYIERDSEKTVLYSPERCFLLEAEDENVSDILSGCGKKGIYIQFLDITPDFGIPCYKAFVQALNGGILKGCGAHLDGKIAAARALTELSYPYPLWCGSVPPPKELKTIMYEDLPDYSSGNVSDDLQILEKLLIRNGYRPIYIDLTRRDLGIPVVKVIIPGLEMMHVLDMFSNFNKRQFRDYLGIVKAEKDKSQDNARD
jgi:ribosomal protein S12 methylthiotransferase accessory factor